MEFGVIEVPSALGLHPSGVEDPDEELREAGCIDAHTLSRRRSTVTSCAGLRGRVMSCQEKVMGVCAVIGAGFLLAGDRIPDHPLAATVSNASGDPMPEAA